MVHYKLSYFDIKALGEPIRFIFAVAGIPYEDDRVSYEKWPEVKHSKMKFYCQFFIFLNNTAHQILTILLYK